MEIRCGLVYMSWLSEQEILAALRPGPVSLKLIATAFEAKVYFLLILYFSYSQTPQRQRVCTITFNKVAQIAAKNGWMDKALQIYSFIL